jgi:hypothetical protein
MELDLKCKKLDRKVSKLFPYFNPFEFRMNDMKLSSTPGSRNGVRRDYKNIFSNSLDSGLPRMPEKRDNWNTVRSSIKEDLKDVE